MPSNTTVTALLAGVALACPMAASAQSRVSADFSQVVWYPNLKSKLGLSSNVRRTEMIDAVPFIDDLGPGLMCGNIEFDYWFKWGPEPMPALSQRFDGKRPVALDETPGAWLTEYQRAVGDLDVAMLFQLTGAPAQYQIEENPGHDVHPAPTDLPAAAGFMAEWTASAKHPYPVIWSLWNEPNHTLIPFLLEEKPEPQTEKERRKAEREERRAERKADRAAQGGKGADMISARPSKADAPGILAASAEGIVDIFAAYSAAMRPAIGPYSRIGMASFIAANFNPDKTTPEGKVYFDAVADEVEAEVPGKPVDVLTFNSFNGGWPVILNGLRAVVGSDPDYGMAIFTQYAPDILKTNEDGEATKRGGIDATPMQAAVATLDDLAQLMRATDVQHVCVSYWIGANYGLLKSNKRGLVPMPRYHALKMLQELPSLRVALDIGAGQVGGLAGINGATASVLLWNRSARAVDLSLEMTGLPPALEEAQTTVTLIDDGTDKPAVSRLRGGGFELPPYGVALVERRDASADDPLSRRRPIDARFLQTRSFPDRAPASCGAGQALPGVSGCAGVTGTYGFFDSVRAAAYLGQGNGDAPARVTASYAGLPDSLYVAAQTFGPGASATGQGVTVAAAFAGCDAKATAQPVAGEAYHLLDLTAVPADCRRGGATLTFALSGVPAGTQAEVWLDDDRAEAAALSQFALAEGASRAVPDMDEDLPFEPLHEDEE